MKVTKEMAEDFITHLGRDKKLDVHMSYDVGAESYPYSFITEEAHRDKVIESVRKALQAWIAAQEKQQ